MSARLRGATIALVAYTVMSVLTACSLSPAVGGNGQQGPNSTADESISGIVISASGVGIGGVSVMIGGTTKTLTDTSGSYTLSGLTPGSYSVSVSKSGYAFSPSSQTETVNGSNLSGVDFSGQPNTVSYSISGTVSAANNGGPVAGITVSLGALMTTTGSSGTFTFSNLTNGSYTVTASYPNDSFTPSSQSITINGANVVGADFTATAIGGLPVPPAIPTVPTYNGSPPASGVVLVGASPLAEDFEPTVTGAYVTSAGAFESLPYTSPGFVTDYPVQRVQLVNTSGTITANPSLVPNLVGFVTAIRALTTKPSVEITEYWQLLGLVHRYSAGTITSITTTYTYGVSNSQTSSFTSTVGASATASVGVGPAKFSATISTQFSSTTSSTMNITSTQSRQTTFKAVVPATEDLVYTVWQLVYEVRLALYDPTSSSADQFGYVPYSDPNFSFLASDMAPVYVYQENEIVPETQYFPAPAN